MFVFWENLEHHNLLLRFSDLYKSLKLYLSKFECLTWHSKLERTLISKRHIPDILCTYKLFCITFRDCSRWFVKFWSPYIGNSSRNGLRWWHFFFILHFLQLKFESKISNQVKVNWQFEKKMGTYLYDLKNFHIVSTTKQRMIYKNSNHK